MNYVAWAKEISAKGRAISIEDAIIRLDKKLKVYEERHGIKSADLRKAADVGLISIHHEDHCTWSIMWRRRARLSARLGG